jgi:hypothetical protein
MFTNITARVIFGLNRCNKVVARSSARVSSRSPANKQFDRRFNTRSYLKNQEKLDDSPRLIFKEGAIGKSRRKIILRFK